MRKITLLLFLLSITFNSYAQFPEGFETAVPPAGWTSFIGTNGEGTGDNWTTSTSAASGTQAAYVRFENVANEAEDWLVTPQFTPSSSGSILTFMQKQSYTNNYGATYTVRVSSASQTSHGDFTIVDTQSEADFGTSYASHTVDLSAYNGTPIYVAFVHANDNGDDWYIDDVDLMADAMAPNCVDNLSPVDGANVTINPDGTSVTLTWDASVVDNSHDAATSYAVMWGTESGNLTSLGSIATAGVTITNLSYSTTYYWMIIPSNVGGAATGCSENSFTAGTPAIPFSTDFTSYPAGFSESTGPYLNPSASASNWLASDFLNDVTLGKGAKVNIWSINIDEYLISPNFDLSAGTHYLNIDAGITGYDSSGAFAGGMDAGDDYVAVLLSEDDGASWSELYRWDSTSGLTNAAEAMPEVTLSTTSATAKIALYAFSGVSGGDYDFHITNFQVTTETLSTATNTLEGFSLYPTIVKEELNFRSQNNVEAITVFNLLGQKVFSGAPNTNNSSINLSNLRPGVYVVKVSAEGKIGSYKIIKE